MALQWYDFLHRGQANVKLQDYGRTEQNGKIKKSWDLKFPIFLIHGFGLHSAENIWSAQSQLLLATARILTI